MKFVHMSPRKIKSFKTPQRLLFSFKPHGCLWFSCGDQWETFVKDGMMEGSYDVYKYKYEADLDETKLIVLKTYKDIKEFSDKFLVSESDIETEGLEKLNISTAFINWDKVRKDTGKDGIYLKNAQIKRARLDFLWYYSFDICSVAVWGKDAIKSIQQV